MSANSFAGVKMHRPPCRNTVQERSCVRGILSSCEKTPRKQDKSPVTSVAPKHGIVFVMYFFCPSQAQQIGVGLLHSDYLLSLTVVMQSVPRMAYPMLVCSLNSGELGSYDLA